MTTTVILNIIWMVGMVFLIASAATGIKMMKYYPEIRVPNDVRLMFVLGVILYLIHHVLESLLI